MRVLLFNPPRSGENRIYDHAPAEARQFIHRKLIGPPLGLLVVAAALGDHDVSIFDCKGEYDLDPSAPVLDELAEREIRNFRPDVVGVTVIASELPAALAICRVARRIDPRILTVAGGLQVTLCPEDLNDPAVDVLVPGPGAVVFRELLRALESQQSAESVPGLFVRKNGRLATTGVPAGAANPAVDDFFHPNRRLLDRWKNTYRVGGSPHLSTYVYTSLGCPYRCTFCSIWSQFQGAYHQRDVESIITELKGLDDYGVVRFADANTIVNVDFIDRLFDRIAEEGIKKFFIMDIRFDTAARHPALIEKLAHNGLGVVICGFESFRDEELHRYDKGSPAVHIASAIEVFHRNGIHLRGNYVVPPDYDLDDFAALAAYAGSHRVVYAGYTILTPMPGTQLHHEMTDRIVDRDLSRYNFFNSVMMTRLPSERFHEEVGRLWLIKKGTDVI